MTTATITKRRQRRQYLLPANWAEVDSLGKTQVVLSVIVGAPSRAQCLAKLIRLFMPLPERAWQEIQDEEMSALSLAVEWMLDAPIDKPYIRYWGNWQLPEESLFDLRAIEYDELEKLSALLSDPEQSNRALAHLLAVLWVPKGNSRPIYDANAVQARIPVFESAPMWLKYYTLRAWQGYKLSLRDRYERIFPPPGNASIKEDPDEMPEADLGWLRAFFEIAADGPLGTFEQVCQTPLHDVCTYLVLVKEREDRAAIRAQREKSIAENRKR